MATSSAMLIATRALMGVGGAFIMPSTLSILTAVFPAHERPRAIGIWAGVSGLGIAIGPITGGWLLEHGSGFAAVVLGAFAAWELRVREPMLDVRLFRNRRFSAASAAISLAFFALFGMIFFLTQYLQSVLGYSALESGVRVMPVALGLIVGGPLSARVA